MTTPSTSSVPDPLTVSASDAARLLGICRSQLWRLHSAGRLPAPVYLGSRAPRWRVAELRAWLDAGCPDRQTWQRLREARR